ncbi:MAG: hypothetical protein ABL973_06150 [Micropepsaceae bacterium]
MNHFARRVFQAAGIWGLSVLTLGYAVYLAGTDPSLLNVGHPELVHGFFLVCFPWQILFLVIATDPARYNALMPVAVLEKLPFTAVVLSLYFLGQVGVQMLVMAAADGLFGILFCIAYWGTRRQSQG